jgi:hypothetical protein
LEGPELLILFADSDVQGKGNPPKIEAESLEQEEKIK